MALEIKGVKDSFGFKRLLGVIHRFLECYDTSVEEVLKCHLVVSLLALLQYISHTVVEVDKMIAMQGDEVQLGARI